MTASSSDPDVLGWLESRLAAPAQPRGGQRRPPRVVLDFTAQMPASLRTHYHRRTATITVSTRWWWTASAEARWVALTEAIAQHLCAWGPLSDVPAVGSRIRQIPDLGARMVRVGFLRSEDGVWLDALAGEAEAAACYE